MSSGLKIREFRDELAPYFRDINAEWIRSMFRLEDTEERFRPRRRIMEQYGARYERCNVAMRYFAVDDQARTDLTELD